MKGVEMRRRDLDNLHIAGEDWDHVTSQIHVGKTTRSARVESYNDTGASTKLSEARNRPIGHPNVYTIPAEGRTTRA
jgi:hypothetical protein